jgi:purine-nucleoside phosphorylase
MSTPHFGANKGDIAEAVLLPGDPLRAKYIAETYLENPVCYNEVRNMFGFTGTYKGKKVSVQGTGMGIPSLMIYVTELINEYGAKKLVRIGSCGAVQQDIKVRDVVMAMSASTDSAINKIRFSGKDYAATANAELFINAYDKARELGINVKAGNILTSDTFYHDDPDAWKIWADFGILAIEMETAGLFTVAAKYGVQALSLLTVSDHILTGEVTTAKERQESFDDMIKIALEAV